MLLAHLLEINKPYTLGFMSRLLSSIPLVSMSIFMPELHYFDYSSPSLSWTSQVALVVRNPPGNAG